MSKQKYLLVDEDEKNSYVMSQKRMCYGFLIGFILMSSLITVCGIIGYYFGFIFSQDITPTTNFQTASNQNSYMIGLGRADVTGPIVQVNMMGYANPSQIANGLHQRLYARSFIVKDEASSVVFVTVDCGMGSQIIKLEVVKRLKQKFGDLYTERNVIISGTHSHSGPAGFFQTLLPEVTSLGAIKQTTDAFVDGIVKSIETAHSGMKRGKIRFSSTNVSEGNANRSPYAYDHDPAEERSKYQHNTEQEMMMLKFETDEGYPMGQFNWYPVHGTSMNSSNGLISSDNKGRASALFEKEMRKDDEMLSGTESFVAAFASANLGDVSPNTKGAKCIDTGKDCDYAKSTCGTPARVQKCIAFGPGDDMFESTDIIAKRQLVAAKAAYNSAGESVNGSIGFVHQYVDMTKEVVHLPDGTNVTTCKPGMGYSFAAGTTDGPGAFDFTQAMTKGTFLWNMVRDEVIVRVVCSEKPTKSYYDCHHPKPVLLPTGYMDKPYAWHPHIIDVQILKIGQVFILAIPGEFTTMSGRRVKQFIKEEAIRSGIPNPKVVLAGLSNVYTHYITTKDEYQAQRYEGASTIFGPNTLQAYIQKFTSFIPKLIKNEAVEPGPSPANILDKQIELLPPPLLDSVPSGKSFGDVISDVESSYKPGQTVSVTFQGANPRHNMKLGETYLKVQHQLKDPQIWQDDYIDADWETKLMWKETVRFGDNSKPQPTNVTRNILTNMLDLVTATSNVHFDYNLALDGNFDLDETSQPNSNFFEAITASKNSTSKKPSKVKSLLTAESHVTITWAIPRDQQSGIYRIVYFGDKKEVGSEKAVPFTGTSSSFTVTK